MVLIGTINEEGEPTLRRPVAPLDLTGDIIAFECGELSEEDTIALFQNLIDTGLAWSLQGTYGRTAAALIENGVCHAKV